ARGCRRSGAAPRRGGPPWRSWRCAASAPATGAGPPRGGAAGLDGAGPLLRERGARVRRAAATRKAPGRRFAASCRPPGLTAGDSTRGGGRSERDREPPRDLEELRAEGDVGQALLHLLEELLLDLRERAVVRPRPRDRGLLEAEVPGVPHDRDLVVERDAEEHARVEAPLARALGSGERHRLEPRLEGQGGYLPTLAA